MRLNTGSFARIKACVTLCLALAGCGAGDITYVIPPSPPNSNVTLTLAPEPQAVGLATALGWGSAIPGATVSVIPVDSSAPPVVLESSATGQVSVPDLTPGAYLARVQRMLSPAEMAKLPPTEGVEGWATLARIQVTATTTSFPVAVQASRRKSLMISEWSFNTFFDFSGWSYDYAQYIELYNNADTTVYLDGMRFGQGFHLSYDYPNWPCSAYTQATDDPTSIWAIDVQMFPGTGHDYPVAPGQVVLVAIDAIDHTVIAKGAPDLSHADFEQEASQDVDNPAVPNMISVGPRFQTYHGILLNPLANVVFLSLPVTPADLRYAPSLGSAYLYERYPVGKLLDVATWWTDWTGQTYPSCPQVLSPAIDRGPARGFGSDNYDFEAQRSLHRVQLRPGSRPIFQHTSNSAADFIIKLRSPGTLSPPP